MKASGCWVIVLLCLMVVLQTVSADEDDHEEGGGKGRKCGRVLSQVDLGDTGMVVTDNAITMRRLKEKNCGLALGLECGKPTAKAKGKAKMEGEEPEDGDEGKPGGKGGKPAKAKGRGDGEDRKIETPGGKRNGRNLCKKVGKLTEFSISALERLNDTMGVENSTTDIILSQEDLDTKRVNATIPMSQSEKDPDSMIKSAYLTVTASAPGREENTTCKARLHIYVAAGNGNTSFENDVTIIKKGDIKVNLEVTDADNCFCNADGSGCAPFIRFKYCLMVREDKPKKGGKKAGKKVGKRCKDDSNKNCGQRVENDDGSRLDVPNKCRIDGNMVTLEGSTGSVSIDGDTGCIDMVVPKFSSLFCDPVFSGSEDTADLTDDDDDETNNAKKLVSSGISLLILVVLALLLTH